MKIALILSGGIGTRLGGDIPKQYMPVRGKPILFYSLKSIVEHSEIDAFQIVADSRWHATIEECIRDLDAWQSFRGFSKPGDNRQLSIFHGLADMEGYAGDNAAVLIHDAARPCLSDKQITESFAALAGHDGVLPVLPMKDTVYLSKDGKRVSSLLQRREIYAGQAPETFVLGKYLEANRRLLPEKILEINGSTEPAILAGMDIVMIAGDEKNFKITTREDLERFRQMMSEKSRKQE